MTEGLQRDSAGMIELLPDLYVALRLDHRLLRSTAVSVKMIPILAQQIVEEQQEWTQRNPFSLLSTLLGSFLPHATIKFTRLISEEEDKGRQDSSVAFAFPIQQRTITFHWMIIFSALSMNEIQLYFECTSIFPLMNFFLQNFITFSSTKHGSPNLNDDNTPLLFPTPLRRALANRFLKVTFFYIKLSNKHTLTFAKTLPSLSASSAVRNSS